MALGPRYLIVVDSFSRAARGGKCGRAGWWRTEVGGGEWERELEVKGEAEEERFDRGVQTKAVGGVILGGWV